MKTNPHNQAGVLSRHGLSVFAATLGSALFATGCLLGADAAVAQVTAKSADAQIKRGLYLVRTSGCHDCHTPFKMGEKGPEPDKSRMLSGHPEQLQMPPVPQLPDGPWLTISAATNTAHAGPWGVSFTANLTPDRDTGMGRWTEHDFVQTIRTGRHLGRGRAVLPPMPIPVYNNFTDADLKAMFAYLKSIPPVVNKVPEPVAPSGR